MRCEVQEKIGSLSAYVCPIQTSISVENTRIPTRLSFLHWEIRDSADVLMRPVRMMCDGECAASC